MYSAPDKKDPVDRLAHYLSEVHNDAAPMGWHRYRFLAKSLIDKFDLKDAVMAAEIFSSEKNGMDDKR
jgi:hypothetical protein